MIGKKLSSSTNHWKPKPRMRMRDRRSRKRNWISYRAKSERQIHSLLSLEAYALLPSLLLIGLMGRLAKSQLHILSMRLRMAALKSWKRVVKNWPRRVVCGVLKHKKRPRTGSETRERMLSCRASTVGPAKYSLLISLPISYRGQSTART